MIVLKEFLSIPKQTSATFGLTEDVLVYKGFYLKVERHELIVTVSVQVLIEGGFIENL